jgi:hypothetical protein
MSVPYQEENSKKKKNTKSGSMTHILHKSQGPKTSEGSYGERVRKISPFLKSLGINTERDNRTLDQRIVQTGNKHSSA